MKVVPKNWRCKSCGWVGADHELLRADNPWEPQATIVGCPRCKDTGEFEEMCDVPGCSLETSCGTPTATGYRRTCGKHRPEVYGDN